MKTLQQQRGLSFFGLLIILGLIAFFALVTIKVVPLYLENGAINAAFDKMAETSGIGKKGKQAMIQRIKNQFDIEDVKSIGRDDINVDKSEDGKNWIVWTKYEGRAHLFANIGVYTKFEKSVEVPRK